MSTHDDDLSALIQQQARYHKASDQLRAEVRTRIALLSAASSEDVPSPSSPAHASPQRRPWASRWPRWKPALAGFALGVALTCVLVPLVRETAQSWHPSVDAQLVAEHVRSLRAGPLIQVASEDRHTVKPWFQGKLDFAPPVLNLADDGFVLLGARVQQRDGKTIAVLVYEHNKHILNLFVQPSGSLQAPQRHEFKGFNLLYWDDGAMHYDLVSDMDASEVERFGQAWHDHRSRP